MSVRGLLKKTAFSFAAAAGFLVITAADAPHMPAIGTWGVDLSNRDLSLKPGDNFFMYANGSWYGAAEIPPERSALGSFLKLRILSESRMMELAKALAAKSVSQLSAEEKKLHDLYEAYTDRAAIEAKGLAPFKKDLECLAAAKTHNDIARLIGTPRLSLNGPFYVGVSTNDKNADQYALRTGQGGLGMPNRDYYLRDTPELEATRVAYRKHLAGMFKLAGLSDADVRARAVYDLEHKIAEAHWTNAERRDSVKTFNPMTFAELTVLAPQYPWRTHFAAGNLPTKAARRDGGAADQRQVIVGEKSSFPVLAAIFADTPVAVWRDYLTARYLHVFAHVMPTAFDEADFAFHGTVIEGSTQQLPRDARAAHLLDALLGEALGKLYAAKYFPPEAKEKAQHLVDNLLKVYDADIRVLPWMTEPTRQKALDKLHKFTPHIAYPEQWRDYTAYIVKRDDLLGNIQRATEFDWNRTTRRLDDAVVKGEWEMTAPTVNAYYTQSFNAIFFPAAILQPPFFDPSADDAVNYGGIGAVIGHEISHGFDDQGSQCDGNGALNDWWTEADRKAFEASTTLLSKQYDAFEPLPDLHVNGAYTLGENIADLSGATIALKAYHLSLNGKPAPVIDGFTGDQRFFLGYAQIWQEKRRESAKRQQLLTDPHSPAEYRAVGTVRNIDEWYDAFDVKPGDRFYVPPVERVRLW